MVTLWSGHVSLWSTWAFQVGSSRCLVAPLLEIRDVQNRFFNFGSVLEKNSDSVRNEFGSVRFAKTRFGSDSYLLLI